MPRHYARPCPESTDPTARGLEFAGRAQQGLADERGVLTMLIQAGKPTQSVYVELFNASRPCGG